MSAVAELKSDVTASDVRELERKYDALVRACDRKHEELDSLNAQVKAATGRLDKIHAEIARVRAHFGVHT